MVTFCEKRKCRRTCTCTNKCNGFPPSTNDKVVTDQTDANALPDVVDGNLFIADVTNASISVPSYKVKGSVFVSGVTVNSGVWKIEFPNLKSVECDVVIGRDTISPHSDKINKVFNGAAQLSVLFPALKFVSGNIVIGTFARPGTASGGLYGNFIRSGGKQSIKFCALRSVCKNVVIGTLGASGNWGCVLDNGVQNVEMKDRFSVYGNVIVGVSNEQVLNVHTNGNSLTKESNQTIIMECERINDSFVHGILGFGGGGNSVFNKSIQTVDLPFLHKVKENVVCGVLRGYNSSLGMFATNFAAESSSIRISFPDLVRLHASLAIGEIESHMDSSNYVGSSSTHEIDFKRLCKIHGRLIIGSETVTTYIQNFAFTMGSMKVNLGSLLNVEKDVHLGINYSESGGSLDYNLEKLCSVGERFNFLSNQGLNLSHLHWTDHRPLRCIGGPLTVQDNFSNGFSALADLDGLSSLKCMMSTEKSVVVTGNSSLIGYCGLHELAIDPNVSFTISGNAVNKTKAQIASGGSCADAERLASRKSCFAQICSPSNVTVTCTGSIDSIFTGCPTSADPGAVFVYVDVVEKNNNENCKGCIVRREWRDSRCCADKPCTQLIFVKCRCEPRVACPPDVILESGSPCTPEFTGTAVCECKPGDRECLKDKICCGNGNSDGNCKDQNSESGNNQNEGCTVSYEDEIVSKYLCSNGAPKHVERTWTCTNKCGNIAKCVQNIYFHRPDRFPLC